ncbi:MAG: flap endonuclease-1 [Candidatus Aenigmatarchaeota archaeon]
MGVQITEIIERKQLAIADLAGKTIAIDAYNSLYQFLSIIRQPDGTPLMDFAGRITSHLSGLFYRTAKLMEAGIMPVYVFDGIPPEFKRRTIEKRRAIKAEAEKNVAEALERGDIEGARKASTATSRLTKEMAEESKRLLDLMGIPVIQAPSEAEAQASRIVKNGHAWAAGSQDYDALLFGAPKLIRNLTITGRRKLPKKETYIEIKPELIDLKKALGNLGLDQKQLITIGILIGTDFNQGIKGIGPKKALQLVKSKSMGEIFTENDFGFDDPAAVMDFFMNPPVTDEYEITWRKTDEDGIKKMMVEEHSFSEDRVAKVLETLRKRSQYSQKSLGSWFR